MVSFPNCKINLGLRITEKRTDGFHNLESVFLPIPWYDALEIIEARHLSISLSGIQVPGNTENNLCMRAWHLLKNDFPGLPPVSIYLHKTIPAGAGLGGGSSNGTAMLSLLNEKFAMGISGEQLIRYALMLGSDCPFFIHNRPALAKGRGEVIQPLQLSLKGYYIMLVNPCIHIPTGWAFSRITPSPTLTPLELLIQEAPDQWAQLGLVNDFEAPVFTAHPDIASIKQKLLARGALYASMTGTGSTCFGIFATEPESENDFPDKYLVKKVQL